ncbi:UNVERIFIED_CONTAM: hypothetical protein Sangu_0716800 [Sesamum angustifolium]|uniref:Uncharacterized protein n=1 Tax=Sesamum angustifolium TaxID=2727405 RepID=A0AAW2PU58_9LAMI
MKQQSNDMVANVRELKPIQTVAGRNTHYQADPQYIIELPIPAYVAMSERPYEVNSAKHHHGMKIATRGEESSKPSLLVLAPLACLGSVLMPKTAMAITIAASILGQVIGSRAERHRLKTAAAKKLVSAETSISVSHNSGHCGEIADWMPDSLHVPPPPADVIC